MGRPVAYPGLTLVLPPHLCGPVGLYALAWPYGSYRFDWDAPFDKRRKQTHRFTIADTRGPLSLTVPIAKPESSRCRWSDIRISAHDEWWHLHRTALESAYGRTPYFEFYIDRFSPMLQAGVMDDYPTLRSLADAWEERIAGILGFDAPAGGAEVGLTEAGPELAETMLPPYTQVRQQKLGFIAGLSILDLIFNLGPEAQLWLNSVSGLNR